MGRCCFAPRCKTGYRSTTQTEIKLSLFKAPSDAALLDLWKKSIPRKDKELSSKDHLCEIHFEKHLVVKEWKAEQNGKILMTVPTRAKLVAGAVPTIFPGCPGYLSKKIKAEPSSSTRQATKRKSAYVKNVSKKLKTTKLQPTEFKGLVANTTSDSVVQKVSKKFKTTKLQPTEGLVANTTSDSVVQKVSKKLKTTKLQPTEFKGLVANTTSDSVVQKAIPNSLTFEQLCSKSNEIKLPSESWCKCVKTDFVKNVSFFECGFTETEVMRVCKQVTVGENLEFKVFILEKRVPTDIIGETPCSLNEIPSFLTSVNNLKICSGVLHERCFQSVRSQSCYIDIMGRWRHNRCEIFKKTESVDGFRCLKCYSLEQTLHRYVNRKVQKKVPVRFGCRPQTSPTKRAYTYIVHTYTEESYQI